MKAAYLLTSQVIFRDKSPPKNVNLRTGWRFSNNKVCFTFTKFLVLIFELLDGMMVIPNFVTLKSDVCSYVCGVWSLEISSDRQLTNQIVQSTMLNVTRLAIGQSTENFAIFQENWYM